MVRSEIRALTGLRGVAAVFVVVFHEAGNFTGTGIAATILRHGYNAVDLFFVLSGFVMALTYGAQFKEGGARNEYFSFLGRRIARIYPLYALATLFALGISEAHLSQIAPVTNPLTTLAFNLVAIQSWGLAVSIVGPAWSISTEWGAYLVFPILAYFALSKPSWRPTLLAAFALAGLGMLTFLPDVYVLGHQSERLGPLDLYDTGTIVPLLRCITSFSLGLVAYRWRDFFKPAYSLFLVVALILVLTFRGSDVFFVLVCVALIPSLAGDTGLVARALSSAPIYALGLWSYSIYIIHARFNPVRSWAERLLLAVHAPMAPQVAVGVSTLAVVVCAALTYRYIEIPGRSFLRKMLALRRGSSIAKEPAAP
jgi:peptidoglycan/LPS O-acetylase OafA/YrhL